MKNQISLYQGSFNTKGEAELEAKQKHVGRDFEIEVLKSQGKQYYNLIVKFNIG